jgi:hypothetical protein
MENTPPKTIAGLILFNLPHLRESVNPAKPSAEINAARFPFIPLKERPPLTIIKIPIIEKTNAHQVAFRIGSFSKGQAKIAVRNGAQANKKAAFAMEVVWKAYILPAKAKTRDIAAVKPAKPIFVKALRGCPFDCQYIKKKRTNIIPTDLYKSICQVVALSMKRIAVPIPDQHSPAPKTRITPNLYDVFDKSTPKNYVL